MQLATLILGLGLIIIASILMKEILSRLKLPALVGYMIIGVALSAVDSGYGILSSETEGIIHFLAKIGVIILLFYIGLESKLHKLLEQIWHATFIGISGIIISAVLGFAAAYYLLGLSFFVSLVIGAAMVATSVGITAGIWQENNAIETDQGQLLLDIAEFDDITGIIIMVLLFSIAPVIAGQNDIALPGTKILKTFIPYAAKFFIFIAACLLFAKFAEKPLSDFFENFEKPPEKTLTIIAIGLIIAALADLVGFSAAIGAFFAGLIFSRDPASIKEKSAIDIVYDLFVPFFFIGIGLKVHITTVTSALLPALVFFAAAVLGKFLGTVMPALLYSDKKNSALLGISMIPRAEITMIIMQRSLHFKDRQIPKEIYSAMVIVVISTCIISPLILNRLIGRIVKTK